MSMLDGLLKANPSPQDRQDIDLYRTFCLFALGGVQQATTVAEEMIRRDPSYRPNLDEVPPRLQALFSDAKRRLLPAILQQRYLAAKAAFDRNDNRTASEGFGQVLRSLSDPDIAEAARQPPLADLKVLASGFNDLSTRSLTPPPVQAAQTAAPATTALPAPTPASPTPASPPSPPAKAGATTAAAPTQTPRTAVIYSKDSPGVTHPTIVRQDLPTFPGRLTAGRRGIVDGVIDVNGAVESATMVESIDPVYNRMVLAAAKGWVYRPARLDGQPVKFLKRIEISIAAGTAPAF
jgi:hypothetical protein